MWQSQYVKYLYEKTQNEAITGLYVLGFLKLETFKKIESEICA